MIQLTRQTKINSHLILSSICLLALFLIGSCQNATTKAEKIGTDNSAQKVDTVKHFDIALLDNKKDPSCGMPVSAGIGDTAHYKNKVLGFCSSECKAEFVKNPEAMLAAAEMKK